MAVLKVYNGASWGVAIGKTYNGAAWEDKMKFYDGSAFQDLYPASGPTVSAQANGANNFRFAANCYAGVQFRVDGTEWECLNTGVWSSPQGDWLD
ncbi:hypothetical protein LCGC14_3065760, partial [marine sediment metagenome]